MTQEQWTATAELEAIDRQRRAKEALELRALVKELTGALDGVGRAMRSFTRANPNIRLHGPEVEALENAATALAKARPVLRSFSEAGEVAP